METLEEMRKSIDNIDNAIVAMLAERFKVTNRAGLFKAQHGLPPKDYSREADQYTRITELAQHYGLDEDLAKMYLSMVIGKVVESHKQIAQNYLK